MSAAVFFLIPSLSKAAPDGASLAQMPAALALVERLRQFTAKVSPALVEKLKHADRTARDRRIRIGKRLVGGLTTTVTQGWGRKSEPLPGT